jgi:hypothetical protein
LTGVYFVTVFYFEKPEAEPESLKAGGFLFIIYSDVKDKMRVRMGCKERVRPV